MGDRLKGKVAVVTGAGGLGIGQGCALMFAREGADVVGCDIDQKRRRRDPAPSPRPRVCPTRASSPTSPIRPPATGSWQYAVGPLRRPRHPGDGGGLRGVRPHRGVRLREALEADAAGRARPGVPALQGGLEPHEGPRRRLHHQLRLGQRLRVAAQRRAGALRHQGRRAGHDQAAGLRRRPASHPGQHHLPGAHRDLAHQGAARPRAGLQRDGPEVHHARPSGHSRGHRLLRHLPGLRRVRAGSPAPTSGSTAARPRSRQATRPRLSDGDRRRHGSSADGAEDASSSTGRTSTWRGSTRWGRPSGARAPSSG